MNVSESMALNGCTGHGQCSLKGGGGVVGGGGGRKKKKKTYEALRDMSQSACIRHQSTWGRDDLNPASMGTSR